MRRVKKEDLKRIAKATGGSVVVTLADMEGAWRRVVVLVGGGEGTGVPRFMILGGL